MENDIKLKLYKPEISDLWFKKLMLSDEDTMPYNHAYGGTISFSEDKWNEWYYRWIENSDNKHFYRYLVNEDNNYIGEISYHFDETIKVYIIDIIIYAKYRGKGYGTKALGMLFSIAKEHGISVLYDNIAIDNPSIGLFLKLGFVEEYRNGEFVMLKKELCTTCLDLSNSKFINYSGRVGERDSCKVFYNANSGFEFGIIGSKVISTLIASKNDIHIRVYVDDDLDGKIINISPNKTEYVLVESLENKKHIIKVVKANSESFGFITLSRIITYGDFIELEQQNKLKVEFYGDSLVAGYGVNSLNGDTYENEDPTKAYAKLFSEHFDAELSSLCVSGVSLALPIWIPFPLADRYQGYYLWGKDKWDFSKWIPDIVFICLGTNDACVISKDNKSLFIDKALKMIKELKSFYPKAKIVCYYGMVRTNDLVNECYKYVIEQFKKEDQIYYFNSKGFSTSGFNGHFNLCEQRQVANELINFVEKDLKNIIGGAADGNK